MISRTHKSLLTGTFIAFVLVGVVAFPRPAYANLPVIDTQQLLKEFGLDIPAWLGGNAALAALIESTVMQIIEGEDGGTAFVTNLQGMLLDVADAAADDFLQQLRTHGSIESPFRSIIAEGVAQDYYQSTGRGAFFNVNHFTLGQKSQDPAAFLRGDFRQGGFPAWIESAKNMQNDPYGAAISAKDELAKQVISAKEGVMTQADWGQGFLPRCAGNALASSINVGRGGVSLSENALGRRLTNCVATTAGSTVASTLHEALPAPMQRIIQSDELSEVLGALFSNLIGDVLGGDGLTGINRPSTNGGRSALQRATDPSQDQETLASIGDQYLQIVNIQRGSIVSFQSGWEKINAAATEAEAAVGGCNEELQTYVEITKDKAAAKLAQAASSLATIAEFEARAEAISLSTENTLDATTTLGEEYQEAQNFFPTATDVTEAERESDTDPDSGSTYANMKSIIEQGCDYQL